MLGNKQIFIKKEVIVTLEKWNTRPNHQTATYDELMVQALLLCCVNADDLAEGNIGDEVKEFIRGKFNSYLHLS